MKNKGRWDAMANLIMPPTHDHRSKDPEDDDKDNVDDMMVHLIMRIGKVKGAQLVDDLIGQVLDARLVRKARRLDMEYFETKNVYTKCPRAEAVIVTGRHPIGVRWVDVNEGDDEEPNSRSRLVAKHFKRRGYDCVFAFIYVTS